MGLHTWPTWVKAALIAIFIMVLVQAIPAYMSMLQSNETDRANNAYSGPGVGIINALFAVISGALAVAFLVGLFVFVHSRMQSKSALIAGFAGMAYFLVIYLVEAGMGCGLTMRGEGCGFFLALFAGWLMFPLFILQIPLWPAIPGIMILLFLVSAFITLYAVSCVIVMIARKIRN